LSRRWVLPVTVVVIAGLLLGALPLRDRLLAERRESGLKEVELGKLPPLGAAGLLLIGGFRGVAVDILWLRVIALHDKREYDEERSLIELITALQPYYISVWVFQAWIIAYNISVEYPLPEDQWKQVKDGIAFLRRGLALNPASGDLYFYLGMMYRDKVHQNPYFEDAMERELGENNFESAAEFFKRARELGGVQTFAPRVVDSGVFHSYFARTLQILQRSELTDNLTFTPEAARKAEPFIEKCREETAGLRKRYPSDAAFELYPARIDLVLYDAYLEQVDKILTAGRCSDESLARARKVLDRALAELAKYTPKYRNTYSEQVIRVRNEDVYTHIPSIIVNVVRELVSGSSAGPAEWRQGLQLFERAASELKRVPASEQSAGDYKVLSMVVPTWKAKLEDMIRKHDVQQKPLAPTAPK
jgi:tetratricopeptide (TPR) repeat protein